MVRQSSHLAVVPLEAPDSATARAMAPPVHLVLPKEHPILLVPGDDGELELRVLSMQALQHVREMKWRSLAACTRAHTPLAVKPVQTPVAIFGSLWVCIYGPASRHWLISYSPIHLT